MFSTSTLVKRASEAAKVLSSSTSRNIHTYTHLKMWEAPRKKTLSNASKKRIARKIEGTNLTSEQFARTRKPFDFPVLTKTVYRPPNGTQLVKTVNDVELQRLQKVPRIIDKFRTGDKVAITLLHCLTDDKTYIVKGTIIAINSGKNYHGRFTLRNHHSGVFYEISYPYWSPFIRRLELLEKTETPYKKTKQGYFIRQWGMKDPRNRAL